jgi:hypothetical protein
MWGACGTYYACACLRTRTPTAHSLVSATVQAVRAEVQYMWSTYLQVSDQAKRSVRRQVNSRSRCRCTHVVTGERGS